jgi:hypothetical protein
MPHTKGLPEEPAELTVADEPEEGAIGFLIDGDNVTAIVTEEPAAETDSGHEENLAENMEDSDLNTIGMEIIEWVDSDILTRQKWRDRLAEGVAVLGIIQDNRSDVAKETAWELVDKTSHPLIAEACVQFQARAISELIPPGGPVKAALLGEKTEEGVAQATRVEDYMNYNLMVENEDYYPETDAMMFMLSLEGSQFKKTYHDSISDQVLSAHIRPENFIVPYTAKSLKQSPRYTHRIHVFQNDMKKYQANGTYRQVDLVNPTSPRTDDDDKIGVTRDEAQGQEEQQDIIEDMQHILYECHCDYLLPDDEEENGGDGIGKPYVITVDKETQTVVSIRRNWEEGDEEYKKIVSFVHFPYIPGDGFYSYGLLHLIGGLGVAATGLLKTILIGAAFASMRGGFKSKDAKLPGAVQLRFGEYIDTELSAEDLAKAFYEPDFKEPGEAIFKILQFVTEMGQRFSSTTENMVGDASNTGPVGTTVALIEQGSKVFSGNHKRLHYAQGREFQQLARLFGKHLPEEGYPYKVPGEDRQILREDFDDRVDVIPVSDPNIFSSTQRIAQAQALDATSKEKPHLYNSLAVEKRILSALKIPDFEDLLIDPDKTRRRDPIAENMCMMSGIPVTVYQDQDHDAHAAVCQDAINRLNASPDPVLKELLPAFYAHVAQHTAYAMRIKYAQAMGIPLPPVNLIKEADLSDDSNPEISLEVDNEISQLAALAIAKLPKPPPIGGPEAEQIAKQLEKKQKELEKREAEINKALKLLKQEGKQVSSAKHEVDRITDKINFERELEEVRKRMRLIEIEKQEIQAKLDIETKQRTSENVHRQAVDAVKGALDKKQAKEDKIEAKRVGEKAADDKIAAAKAAEKKAKKPESKKK